MMANLLSIVALIALSAFFSGTESAYTISSELRLRRAAEGGGRLSQWTYWIHERYDRALATILIGNNLVNIASTSISTMVVITLLGNAYSWVATVVMTILVLIFGEIVPKVVAREVPERFATLVSPILRFLMWLLYPITTLVQALVNVISRLWKGQMSLSPSVTESDLEIMLDTAEEEGAIDENTSELLLSALDFDDVLAYEIITPRVDMRAIDIEDDLQSIINTVLASSYTRLPVYEDSKDNIIGILHLNRFMKHFVQQPGGDAEADIRALLMPVCYVSSTAPLPAVLATMRQQQSHMVVVSDEYGGTLGLLTMEDILEELVGDIWDETDEIDTEFLPLSDGRFEASGDMRMHDFFEDMDMDERTYEGESTTLGGWAVEMLGTYPRPGDTFAYKGLLLTVERVHKRRVQKLLVERLPTEEE